LLVEERCHQGFLQVGSEKAAVWSRQTTVRLQLTGNAFQRHCQLSRPCYACCVGGAAARVGRSFGRLLCCRTLTERGAKRRPGSAKLTMPLQSFLSVTPRLNEISPAHECRPQCQDEQRHTGKAADQQRRHPGDSSVLAEKVKEDGHRHGDHHRPRQPQPRKIAITNTMPTKSDTRLIVRPSRPEPAPILKFLRTIALSYACAI
jgi:hypothetical protein